MSAVSQPGEGRLASCCPLSSPGAAADGRAETLTENRVSVDATHVSLPVGIHSKVFNSTLPVKQMNISVCLDIKITKMCHTRMQPG